MLRVWKGKLSTGTLIGGLSDGVGHQKQTKTGIGSGDGDRDGVSEALKRKDQVMREGQARGG